MSVGENFTLIPLSNFFVKKSQVHHGPLTNLGLTQPIDSGLIQVDAINRVGNPVGMFTWYRLSHFSGSPNTQGAELREYLLVLRGVSSESTVSFDIPIPEGAFNANYRSAKLLYTDFSATHPGAGVNITWNISFTFTLSHVHISAQSTVTPIGHSFFFYVMGI
jgi:hypothetical protein